MQQKTDVFLWKDSTSPCNWDNKLSSLFLDANQYNVRHLEIDETMTNGTDYDTARFHITLSQLYNSSENGGLFIIKNCIQPLIDSTTLSNLLSYYQQLSGKIIVWFYTYKDDCGNYHLTVIANTDNNYNDAYQTKGNGFYAVWLSPAAIDYIKEHLSEIQPLLISPPLNSQTGNDIIINENTQPLTPYPNNTADDLSKPTLSQALRSWSQNGSLNLHTIKPLPFVLDVLSSSNPDLFIPCDDSITHTADNTQLPSQTDNTQPTDNTSSTTTDTTDAQLQNGLNNVYTNSTSEQILTTSWFWLIVLILLLIILLLIIFSFYQKQVA